MKQSQEKGLDQKQPSVDSKEKRKIRFLKE